MFDPEKYFVNTGLEAKQQVELERVWFAKLANFDDLKKADEVQVIEAYELCTERNTNIDFEKRYGYVLRVRNYNNKRYVLTAKQYGKNNGVKNGLQEKELDIDKEMFEMFKAAAPIGNKKRRYVFNVPKSTLKWEIDVYFDANDKPIEDWVKIDLEIPSADTAVPAFPVELSASYDRWYKDDTPASIEKEIKAYWDKTNVVNPNSILPLQAK